MKKLLLTIFLLIFISLVNTAHAATPTVIGTNATGDNGDSHSNTLRFSKTIPAGNSNVDLLIFVASVGTTRVIQEAAYNGATSTAIGTEHNGVGIGDLKIFCLANPTADGAAHDVVILFSTPGPNVYSAAAAVSIKDADQTCTADGDSHSGSASAVTAASQTITTATNNTLDFVWTFFYVDTSHAQDDAQTEEAFFRRSGAEAGYDLNLGSLAQVTSGNQSLGVTWSAAYQFDQTAIGIDYAAPAADTGATPTYGDFYLFNLIPIKKDDYFA